MLSWKMRRQMKVKVEHTETTRHAVKGVLARDILSSFIEELVGLFV
jgi:hypothetical protein